MNQMFDNFINQSSDYIPNNMFRKPVAREVSLSTETIHPIYRRNKIFAYWWNWGDSVSLEIKNAITIYLPEDSIVSNIPDSYPTTETIGNFVGQKYYNLINIRSFTLAAILGEGDPEDKLYIWEEDKNFTYRNFGKEPIDLEIPLREGEQFVVQLLDFRKEKVKENIYHESPFTWIITPEESLKIKQGIYTLNIHTEVIKEDEEGLKYSESLRLSNSYEIYVMFNGYLDVRSVYLSSIDNSLLAALLAKDGMPDTREFVTADMLATVAFTGMWNDLGQDGDVLLDGDGYLYEGS